MQIYSLTTCFGVVGGNRPPARSGRSEGIKLKRTGGARRCETFVFRWLIIVFASELPSPLAKPEFVLRLLMSVSKGKCACDSSCRPMRLSNCACSAGQCETRGGSAKYPIRHGAVQHLPACRHSSHMICTRLWRRQRGRLGKMHRVMYTVEHHLQRRQRLPIARAVPYHENSCLMQRYVDCAVASFFLLRFCPVRLIFIEIYEVDFEWVCEN